MPPFGAGGASGDVVVAIGCAHREPRGGRTLIAEGAVEGTFHPAVAHSAEELATWADVVLIALPAYGHKVVFDALAPHLRSDQTVLISSHASFGALYLSKLLSSRAAPPPPIVAWGTTATTGRQQDATRVTVNTIRAKIDIATIPHKDSATASTVSRRLFGDCFVERDGLLAIALSNLNPQNHMGIALGNMTRMERGETWSQGQNVTPKVGRLLEALDRERLAIADRLGLSVRTIFEHFHLSLSRAGGQHCRDEPGDARSGARRDGASYGGQSLCHRGCALRLAADRHARRDDRANGEVASGRDRYLLGDVRHRFRGSERSVARP